MLITNGVVKSNVSNRYKYTGNAAPISQTVWAQVAGFNANRVKLSLYNGSASSSTTGIFYLAFGAKPSDITAQTPVDYTFALRPGDLYEDWHSSDAVYAVIWGPGAATDFLYVTEMM